MAQKPDVVLTVETSTEHTLPVPASKNDGKKVAVHAGAKKKRRGINILKVALMLLRRRSGKSNAVDVASKGMWNRLVGSMRPLHLQSNRSPEQITLPPSVADQPRLLCQSREHFEDVSSPPFSPNAPKSSASSSVDSMSRYASAVNLQDLDESDDEEDSENEYDVNMNGGDEMIDVKAEEFIAQFYAQMRLQRSNSVYRYNEMIKRSIG